MAFEKLLSMFNDPPAQKAGAETPDASTGAAGVTPSIPVPEPPPAAGQQTSAPAAFESPLQPPAAAPADGEDAPPAGPLNKEWTREKVIQKLRTVFDPEIPVNIYDLGLIYQIEVTDEGEAQIQMTLTAPNCPAAGDMVMEVEFKARLAPGIKSAKVEVVWEPAWNKDMMSEAARLELGI